MSTPEIFLPKRLSPLKSRLRRGVSGALDALSGSCRETRLRRIFRPDCALESADCLEEENPLKVLGLLRWRPAPPTSDPTGAEPEVWGRIPFPDCRFRRTCLPSTGPLFWPLPASTPPVFAGWASFSVPCGSGRKTRQKPHLKIQFNASHGPDSCSRLFKESKGLG